jgi:hypothetical protein
LELPVGSAGVPSGAFCAHRAQPHPTTKVFLALT